MLPPATWTPTNREYHELDGRWSSTMLKTFRESAELARDCYVDLIQPPDGPTPAMEIGSAIHALLLEHGSGLIQAGASRRDRNYRLAVERSPEALVLPTPDYQAAVAGARAIEQPQTWAAGVARGLLLEGEGENERAIAWEETVESVLPGTSEYPVSELVENPIPCKCKPDRLAFGPGGIVHVDLKTSRDPSPGAFSRQAVALGYDAQAALYRRGIATLTELPIESWWVVIRNQPPFDVAVYRLSLAFLALGEVRLRIDLERLARCLETGVWSSSWQEPTDRGTAIELQPPAYAIHQLGVEMPNVNEMFPSRFLKAQDLEGQEVEAVIKEIEETELDDESKYVVTFVDASKGLVLNKTNATSIAARYGDETDAWLGKPIILYPDRTPMGGKIVDCIRVRVPADPSAPKKAVKL